MICTHLVCTQCGWTHDFSPLGAAFVDTLDDAMRHANIHILCPCCNCTSHFIWTDNPKKPLRQLRAVLERMKHQGHKELRP